MDTKITTYPETAPFVEALRILIQAESKILDAFTGIYGEDVLDNKKETALSQSGLLEIMDTAKERVEKWIGITFELGMTGCLEAPGDPSLIAKTEGVC